MNDEPLLGRLRAIYGRAERSEAEALLDRALAILRDVLADIAHPHAAPGQGDDALRSRIEALIGLVECREAARLVIRHEQQSGGVQGCRETSPSHSPAHASCSLAPASSSSDF